MPISYTGPHMSYQDIGSYVNSAINVEKQLEDQRAEAIRWQGAQEYDTLVKSGVAPRDAFSRTASKLFYNDPRAMASAASDMNLGQGEIFTDEASGRQFIRQPNQKISAVPNQWKGSVTVRGEDGTIYKVPAEALGVGGVPDRNYPPKAPEVVTLPNNAGYMVVQPGGSGVRFPIPKTETVTIRDTATGKERTLTRAEMALEDAMTAATPLINEYNDYKARAAAGQMKYGPDWGWWPTTAYTNQMASIQSRLKDLGLDTEGKPLPGSKLAAQIAGPPAQEQLAPNEIVVDVKGRKIVYDRNTHQPLREIK